jgi:hypothetical protein
MNETHRTLYRAFLQLTGKLEYRSGQLILRYTLGSHEGMWYISDSPATVATFLVRWVNERAIRNPVSPLP